MTRGEAWNTIVKDNNLKNLPQAKTAFNKKLVTKQVEFAISDSGAISPFLVEGHQSLI